jgi:hypothetical protein
MATVCSLVVYDGGHAQYAGLLDAASLLLPVRSGSEWRRGSLDPRSTVYLHDNSDWWSEIRKDLGGEPPGKFLRVPPDPRSFEILGVSVWGYPLHWPRSIVSVLGRTTVVGRGDAATGRDQICYESAISSAPTKLIFETGECTTSFYLFEDGVAFTGSDRCQVSKRVTNDLKTRSGLRLGRHVNRSGKFSARRPEVTTNPPPTRTLSA